MPTEGQDDPCAFEVEFCDEEDFTLALLTLTEPQLEKVEPSASSGAQ